jgi:RNA polymerase sigma-70 factor (ECF subfamily)
MTERSGSDDLGKNLRDSWFRYVDLIEPVRSALHRYCRRITGSLWDAEDLVQETLLRGFGAIGRGDLYGNESRVLSPRAYLFRTATNIWIDGVRRRQFEAGYEVDAIAGPGAADASIGTRDAGAALIGRMPPQERAAVILKDVFDFSLDEIADMLCTSSGGVKSALHRGRARLVELQSKNEPYRHAPSQELVDRFVDAFNAKDIPRLTALLLEDVSIEVQGAGGGRGRRAATHKEYGWIPSSMGLSNKPADLSRRVESRIYRGEPILLAFRKTESGEALEEVWRLEANDGLVARIRDYCFCPETVVAIGSEFGLPTIRGGYHQPSDVVDRMVAGSGLPWMSPV